MPSFSRAICPQDIPSNRLRGFEAGRLGPKDGDDFVGGNYAYSINVASNIPQIFEESQNVDFIFFADAADLWGVDYNSSIEKIAKWVGHSNLKTTKGYLHETS